MLPLTVFGFTLFCKHWYVLPIDAPETLMLGFPLPYVCDGWHTSLSLQIFLMEMLVDVTTQFAWWFVVVYCINRFVVSIRLPKLAIIIMLSVAGLLVGGMLFLASNPDNVFYLKRPFDITVLKTGYSFLWSGVVTR